MGREESHMASKEFTKELKQVIAEWIDKAGEEKVKTTLLKGIQKGLFKFDENGDLTATDEGLRQYLQDEFIVIDDIKIMKGEQRECRLKRR